MSNDPHGDSLSAAALIRFEQYDENKVNSWPFWCCSQPAYSESHRPIQIQTSPEADIVTTTAAILPEEQNVANMRWRWALG